MPSTGSAHHWVWIAVLAWGAIPHAAHGASPDLRLSLPWERTAATPAAGQQTTAKNTRMPLVAVRIIAPDDRAPRPETHRTPTVSAGEWRWLALGTAALTALDEPAMRLFDPDRRDISTTATVVPMAIAILAPALVDGPYGRKTTRLTAMAALNATLMTEGVKFLVGKERPYQSGGELRFHGPGSGYASFPSGHAAIAFAAAEVLGHRYPRYKLAFYLLAAGVGVSRIDTDHHFPSDVFVGAAIGIYHGRLVLRHGGKPRVWR